MIQRVYPNEIDGENCFQISNVSINQRNGRHTVDECDMETKKYS